MEVTTEMIRARLIETAETERCLPAKGTRPSSAKGHWPDIAYTLEDVEGWTAGEREEYRAEVMTAMAQRATPQQVARHDECMRWLIEHVRRPEDRRAVAAWARSKAGRRSFRSWCKKNGLHHYTGQRRADTGISDVKRALHHKVLLWSEPDKFRVWSPEPDSGMNLDTLDDLRPEPTAWRAPDAKPVHTDTDEAAEQRSKDMAAANERGRLRRIKLGLEEPAE